MSDPRTAANEQVEQELLLLLRRVRSRLEQLARDVHPDLDPSAYGILHLVDAGQATSVTDLAALLTVGKPTVSRQVTALAELGLIERLPAELDRRASRLQLTEEGRTRLEAVRGQRAERMRALLGDWPVEDVAALGAGLARFNRLDW